MPALVKIVSAVAMVAQVSLGAPLQCQGGKFQECQIQADATNRKCLDSKPHMSQSELDGCACVTMRNLADCYTTFCPVLWQQSAVSQQIALSQETCRDHFAPYKIGPDAPIKNRDLNSFVKGVVGALMGSPVPVTTTASLSYSQNATSATVFVAANSTFQAASSPPPPSCINSCVADFYNRLKAQNPNDFVKVICSKGANYQSGSPFADCVSKCPDSTIAHACASPSTLEDAIRASHARRDSEPLTTFATLKESKTSGEHSLIAFQFLLEVGFMFAVLVSL
ncbi:hypothetical protein BCR33DRAFT_712260 [Rhizoclosmatium globosum]|uniref:Extracellular membrane protein CFEM domain-containing protein n=1 Tax=Rhizoclosmatium globosum TaxID=329046 RepID=A0A1Y2CYE1_9FUNG|nr:hypothetical protein BCR33DRAFT_712260 [Rhizoclosmatium globosum]|eukprot:ORY52049.1 hypothetical protein BCR33DRAFT_712260 [Rhizoclosmatium globosum]